MDIHRDSWSYLGLSRCEHGIRKFYMFRVLPFGLSTACYVFTKLLRPLVKHWRTQGIKTIIYIDDGIVGAESKVQCAKCKDIALDDIKRAGFVLSLNKCHLNPQQIGAWLGIIIDLLEGKFVIPKEKIQKLLSCISHAVSESGGVKG